MKRSTLLATPIAALLLWAAPSQAWDFSYGYQTVFDANAGTYIVGTQNVRKYSEWENPPVTYWGPSANDVQGLLTSRFDFSAPTAGAHLFASLLSVNWGSRGDYGSSSLWGSTDGVNWQLLLDDPTPPTNPFGGSSASALTYDQGLPSSLLGANSLWLQVRMQCHNSLVDASDPRATWTDAQFSRVEPTAIGNVFQLDVAVVPEPGAFSLAALVGAGMVAFRRKMRAD